MNYDINLIIIPKVNRCGLLKNIRKVPELTIKNWDLNRAYPVKDRTKAPDRHAAGTLSIFNKAGPLGCRFARSPWLSQNE